MIDILIAAILVFAGLFSATIAPLPAVSLTYMATACGVLLTYRVARTQAKLAERKLFLDLMPRRAEWYDNVKTALALRNAERLEHVQTVLTGGVPFEGQHIVKLWQLENESGWLFSEEMLALMVLVVQADTKLLQKQVDAGQGDRNAAMAVGQFASDLIRAQGKVHDYLRQYLYVGDIGKPRHAPIKVAKPRHKWIESLVKGKRI